jgi:hypothetical protein
MASANLDVATRKGVTGIPHYSTVDVDMEDLLGCTLHIQTGMGNTAISEFNEFIDEECKSLSLQEQSTRSKVKHTLTMSEQLKKRRELDYVISKAELAQSRLLVRSLKKQLEKEKDPHKKK